MHHIIALGGGGFLMEDAPSPIDSYIAHATGKAKPRVCFVSTPSGDLPEMIDKFYAAFEPLGCEASHLAFFRRPMRNAIALASLEDRLAEHDAVFVGGGNTKSALAVWREWGLDGVLDRIGRAGTLLTGMSAGALCWFQSGLTDSYWGAGYRPLAGLGFLGGGCCVHYQSEPERRVRLHEALRRGAVPPTMAIDDGAAVVYERGACKEVLAWHGNAAAYRVEVIHGDVIETRIEPRWIGPEAVIAPADARSA